MSALGWRVLVVCSVALAWGGCSKVRERQAIRKYARGAAKANAELRKLRALEAQILVVRKTGRSDKVRAFFKERYLPAFKAYLEAVRAVPTETARLRSLHRDFLRALERAFEAYASYADHVTTATLITAWKRVQKAREELGKAEKKYRRDIAAYYRKNDVRMAEQ